METHRQPPWLWATIVWAEVAKVLVGTRVSGGAALLTWIDGPAGEVGDEGDV